jgi:hypothetical protein
LTFGKAGALAVALVLVPGLASAMKLSFEWNFETAG